MSKNVLNLPYEVFSSLTETEMILLNYINENALFVANNTIKNVSSEAFSSPATIVRFCKKVGFDSYSELKYFIKTKLSEVPLNDKVEVSNQEILEGTRHQLIEAMEMIDLKVLDEIIDLMEDKQTLLYGKGVNEFFINYLTTKLSLLRFGVIAHRDAAIAEVYADIMDCGNVVIILSVSGETAEAIAVANAAIQNSCKIVLFTGVGNSSLAKMADYCLLLPIKKDIIRKKFGFTNYFTLIWVFDVLIGKVAQRKK